MSLVLTSRSLARMTDLSMFGKLALFDQNVFNFAVLGI
jgi:hypothetical protein